MYIRGYEPMTEREPENHDWAAALIACCLALGFALSWAAYELRERTTGDRLITQYRHELDMLTSRQSDLGQLLADPRTQLIRLSPVDDLSRGVRSPVRSAAVAWNQGRQMGAVFCDELKQSEHDYQILFIGASGSSDAVALRPSGREESVYSFNSPQPGASPSQFVLTVADDQAALARGQVQ
jgi:hypothetical protein